MNDENKKDTINPSTDASPEAEETPYQLYMREKAEREKLQSTLNQKDLDYQRKLIKLEQKLSTFASSLEEKNKEIEITKEKYWIDKDSDYKETISNRQRTQEGIIVNTLYDILDKRASDGEHMKRLNVFHI